MSNDSVSVQAEVDRLQAELASASEASADAARAGQLHLESSQQLDLLKKDLKHAEGKLSYANATITALDKELSYVSAKLHKAGDALETAHAELALSKEKAQEAEQARTSIEAASKRNHEQQLQNLQMSFVAEAADQLSRRDAFHEMQLAEKDKQRDKAVDELEDELEEATANLEELSLKLHDKNGAVTSLTSQLKDAQAQQEVNTAQLLHSALAALGIPVSAGDSSASMVTALESAWRKAAEDQQLLSSR